MRDLAEHSHHRKRKSNSANAPSPSPSPAPAPSRVINPVPSPPPTNDRSLSPPENPSVLRTSHSDKVATSEKKSVHAWIIYTSVGGALCFLGALSAVYLLCLRGKNVDTVMPWSTGLSGQLQKAFVTGWFLISSLSDVLRLLILGLSTMYPTIIHSAFAYMS